LQLPASAEWNAYPRTTICMLTPQTSSFLQQQQPEIKLLVVATASLHLRMHVAELLDVTMNGVLSGNQRLYAYQGHALQGADSKADMSAGIVVYSIIATAHQ
jgi:hypothetical protein